jgi:chromosome segregation ATPase
MYGTLAHHVYIGVKNMMWMNFIKTIRRTTMSEFTKRLETIKDKVNSLKISKAKLEEREESLKKEKVELEGKLKELGIDKTEDLEKEIESLEKELEESLSKIEGQL